MSLHRNLDGLPAWLFVAEAATPAGRRQVHLNRRPQPDASRSGPLYRWVVGSQVLLLAFLCSCCSTREPLPVDMTAQKIVLRHAEAAFEVAFDVAVKEDRDALTQYQTKTVSAQNQADLHAAWVAIPTLKAHGADFLQKQIFDRAARDGDWPSGAPPTDERVVYVDAVRMAIDVFLNEGTEGNP